MQVDTLSSAEDAPNDPRAVRMGLIAWVCTNVVVGCLMGSFSVMLSSVEQRMGVSREASSSVGALVIFGSALMAAMVGPIIARKSLRMLLFFGALLSLAGYLLLAFTTSYPAYVGAYMLLFGPSMAITGSVGPATLVTRWFGRNRGLALGLVHINLVVAVMPLLCNWVLEHHGAQAVYLLMAAVVAVALVPATLAVRDHPAGAGPGAGTPAADGPSVGGILSEPAFWALALAAGAVITAIMVLTFNMMPVAQSLGFDRSHGAMLATSQSVAGMAGSLLFGWVADRIGGARGLALIAFNMAVMLFVLQFNLPYQAVVLVIALFGLHGGGMVPNVSRALARALGRDSFSRAFGLQSAISVPMTAIGIWAMGAAFTRTGSYHAALLGVAVLLVACVPLTLWAGTRTAHREG